MWTTNHRTTLETVQYMYKHGGCKCFMNGLVVNVGRDTCFGLTYETTRHILGTWLSRDSRSMDLAVNGVAAGLGTIISSPLNYARNLKYGVTPGHVVPSVRCLLSDLWQSIQKRETWREKIMLLQARLVLGWGTLRVAIGMALGQCIFDVVQRKALKACEGGK